MEITTHQRDAVTIVELRGEVTIYDAPSLRSRLLDILSSADAIEVDTSAVTEIDSSAFQLLYAAERHATQLGKPMQIGARSEAVAALFALYRADEHFGAPRTVVATATPH